MRTAQWLDEARLLLSAGRDGLVELRPLEPGCPVRSSVGQADLPGPGRFGRMLPTVHGTLFAGAGVFLLWINLEWARLTDAGGYNPLDAGGKIEMSLVAFRLAGATLLVPVTEELFWRSFLLRWLERQDFLSVDPQRLGVRALGLSSIFFALEHNMWLAGLIAGLAYGWLYVRTGKLWIPIVAHATTNGLLGVWVLRTQQWQFW